MDLHNLLVKAAHDEGFPLAGGVDLDLALLGPNSTFQEHLSRYDQWIQAGYAGSMEYLVRGRDRRANPRLLFPEAESIFCVAIPYPRSPAGAEKTEEGPRYARYLQGNDYHFTLSEKLERVMQSVKTCYQAEKNRYKYSPLDSSHSNYSNSSTHKSPQTFSTPPNYINADPSAAPLPNELKWKVCVDTSAILERTWAALAGLGWIGKNSLLIHPKYGSYLFLAEVLINQKIGRGPTLLPNYCGNCTRCMQSCPTQAIEKPGLLNSNQCISYWTLEKRQKLGISSEMKQKIGPWVAGCDICQEVCPFNLKPTRQEALFENSQASRNLPTTQQEPLHSPASRSATHLKRWKDLIDESIDEYRDRVKNSAMKRVKPTQFSRNLAIAVKNFLLQKQLDKTDSESQSSLHVSILRRYETETDEIARQEWAECLEISTFRL